MPSPIDKIMEIYGNPLEDRFTAGPVGRESLDEQTLTAPTPGIDPVVGRSPSGRLQTATQRTTQQQDMRDAMNVAMGFAGSTTPLKSATIPTLEKNLKFWGSPAEVIDAGAARSKLDPFAAEDFIRNFADHVLATNPNIEHLAWDTPRAMNARVTGQPFTAPPNPIVSGTSSSVPPPPEYWRTVQQLYNIDPVLSIHNHPGSASSLPSMPGNSAGGRKAFGDIGFLENSGPQAGAYIAADLNPYGRLGTSDLTYLQRLRPGSSAALADLPNRPIMQNLDKIADQYIPEVAQVLGRHPEDIPHIRDFERVTNPAERAALTTDTMRRMKFLEQIQRGRLAMETGSQHLEEVMPFAHEFSHLPTLKSEHEAILDHLRKYGFAVPAAAVGAAATTGAEAAPAKE